MDELESPIIGAHPRLVTLLAQARKLASVPRPVLVHGERGTGKELLARYLHDAGARRTGPFVTINCGAFGGDLLRSELFGHERGAFTGATERRAGKLERADGGTLFLDEVGNMSMEFQEKILRVVEYQEFERTGGTETIRVDVRVVAATNADLERLIEAGEFRADLRDRLGFAVLTLPPLRQRREDIPLLVEHFARRVAEEVPGLAWRRFSPAALEELTHYHWPGNVRQIKHVVEHLFLMGEGAEAITARDLPPEITAVEVPGPDFDSQVEAFQRQLLLNAMKEAGENQRAAAEALGLSYDKFRGLYRKLDLKSYVE